MNLQIIVEGDRACGVSGSVSDRALSADSVIVPVWAASSMIGASLVPVIVTTF